MNSTRETKGMGKTRRNSRLTKEPHISGPVMLDTSGTHRVSPTLILTSLVGTSEHPHNGSPAS